MAVFLDAFERWLRAARYKQDTIERAVRVLRMYLNYCSARNLSVLCRESAEEFLADSGRTIKAHTHLNYWRDLRMSFGFAVVQGLTSRNWIEQIPKPTPSVHERERDITYSEEEMRSLLAVCPAWNWLGVRDRAIVLVLWNCGFRASEVCALLVTDVHWQDGEVLVRDGKGGSRYAGVMDAECAEAVSLHLLRRRHDAALLFTDIHGGPLSRNALLQLLKRLARKAGWSGKSCFTHGFRHAFRDNKRELGLDDTDISGLLGHSTVVSTRTYGRRAVAQKAKARLKTVLHEQGRLAG